MNTNTKTDTALEEAIVPLHIIESVVTALNNGKISEIIDLFDNQFRFIDHALGLEFTDKELLREFFEKSRDFFPDTVVEVISTFECGDHITTEWKVTTQTAPYLGAQFRIRISFHGVSVVHIEDGKITRWSEYYDQGSSWRMSLAGYFTEWTGV
jgi:hypothetical protein